MIQVLCWLALPITLPLVAVFVILPAAAGIEGWRH